MIWKYGFTANEAIAFMRIVRPGSVVGPQQHFMYLKQLEWTKWSVADDLRKTREATAQPQSAQALAAVVTPATPPADTEEDDMEATMAVDGHGAASGSGSGAGAGLSITPHPPSTPPPMNLPPVTPSRHVAAAQARAGAITPPGQPRKTPMAKRVPVESETEDNGAEGDADDSAEAEDVLPALGVAPPAGQQQRRPSAGNARAARAAAASGSRPKAVAASERTTRITRSNASKKTAMPASPIKGSGSSNTLSSPNKLPRLAPPASGATTRAAAKAAATSGPSSRRIPPPTPSRLPQLRRGPTGPQVSSNPVAQQLSEAAMSIGRKTSAATDAESGAWMAQGKDSVVVPKGEKEKRTRPGMRAIRRRRSSFSAADVVA
jgi:cell division cycle 14